MLSGETSIGRYPVEAVRTMDRIARNAEEHLTSYRGLFLSEVEDHSFHRPVNQSPAGITAAIAHAACRLAENLGASAVLTPTSSGATARQVSRFRPRVPIIATSPNFIVQRQLSLEWGVRPLYQPRTSDIDSTTRGAVEAALGDRILRPGDLAVVTGASRPNVPGNTDFINVELA